MSLRAPTGYVVLFEMMMGPTLGGPMRSMGGAEPGAERL
jgi:hypothetical protein